MTMNRRDVLRSLFAAGAIPLQFPGVTVADDDIPNMIGAYGPWAASLVGEQPAKLSYRRPEYSDVGAWKSKALEKVLDCLLQPPSRSLSDVRIESTEEFEGVAIERLSWQLTYGPRTKAVFMKPKVHRGQLPGILGLHDHGGIKFFGHEKITRRAVESHAIVQAHQQS
ncbi:MAG: hypothetical protein ABL921_04950, partial [Pirellula sp.]